MFRGMRFTGGILLLAGVILFGMVRLAIGIYLPQMTAWSNHSKIVSARLQIGASFPLYLSILLMIVGAVFLAIPLIYDFKRK